MPLSAEQFAAYLERAERPTFTCYVVRRRASDEIVGFFTISEIVRGNFRSAAGEITSVGRSCSRRRPLDPEIADLSPAAYYDPRSWLTRSWWGHDAPERRRPCCSRVRATTCCSSTGSFPSEVPHGHLIHRHGPQRLAHWGLLDRVLATGCPPIASLSVDLDDFALVGRDLWVDAVPVGLGPRRAALDRVLVEAAVEAREALDLYERKGIVPLADRTRERLAGFQPA